MVKHAPKLELGQPLAAVPLNQYLPHKWFSPNTWSWLYAIKKQPQVGTWVFIQEGDNVRIFECEAARDAEIVHLQQLEQAAANARHKEQSREV